MLDLERARMAEAVAFERAAADASGARVAAETSAVARERDALAVARARTASGARARRSAAFGDGDQAGGDAGARVSKPRRAPPKPSRLSMTLTAVFQRWPRKTRKTQVHADAEARVAPPPKRASGLRCARAGARPSRKKTKKAPRRASRRRARLRRSRPTRAGTPSWRRRREGPVRPLAALLSDTRAEERARRAAAGVLANVAASPECHEALADAEGFVPVLVGLLEEGARGSGRVVRSRRGSSRRARWRPSWETSARRLGWRARAASRRRRARRARRATARARVTKKTTTTPKPPRRARRGGGFFANFCASTPRRRRQRGVAGALEGADAAQCATLESARKHAALALYHMTRRPDLAARVVDAGGRRAP